MVIQGHFKPFSLAHVGSTIIDPKTKKKNVVSRRITNRSKK